MSTTTISQHSCTTVTRRPAVDILVEKLARRLLAWSVQRQAVRGQRSAQPSHERMALMRENERARASAGSSFGR